MWSVAFTPDGRTLATGTTDDAAALWDVAEVSGPARIATLRCANVTGGCTGQDWAAYIPEDAVPADL